MNSNKLLRKKLKYDIYKWVKHMKELNSDIINEYINNNKNTIFKEIIKSAQSNTGKEENFRTDMAIILNKIFTDLKINTEINIEQEYNVYHGRIDSLYGNIIIEYKAPGKIKNTINNPINIEYIEQVKKQIKGLSLKNNLRKDKILGTIFDGKKIIYIRFRNNDWEVSNIIEVTETSLEIFLKRILSLGIQKKALIIENLLKDFSSENPLTKKIVKNLYEYYHTNKDFPKVNLLFEQWKQLYREICGYDFDTLDRKIKNLKEVYNITEEVKLDYLIFAIHTYFALIIKFLSIEVLTYLSNKKQNGLNHLKIENIDELKLQLEDMEQGGLYKKLGINNFLEGDFFAGYLYFWNDEMYKLIRELIEIFRNYDYSSINLEPELAKDLLKNVYHNLFPRELRHNLGEYYTPDWLAEFLLNKMNIDFSANKTFLDPTCGSGTFIVLMIKKYIETNQNQMTKKELLNNILHSIKGYDLNPLAVISARANYIISLGDLINERNDNIEIPIYLCDSMLTVLEQKRNDRECYIVSTKAGEFPIPTTIVDNGNANSLLDSLNKCIKMRCSCDEFIEKLKIEQSINNELIVSEQAVLRELYNIMDTLEKKGLDGIWANVIKNSFAPIFQKKVDYIIGNPPWIVWQSLPEEYRNSIQTYWQQYKIFEHKGLTARLGSSHDDLSVLMTYVIMDNFLKDNGKLGFIVNQNIFQSSGGGQGFRKFVIKESTPIKIEEVDDFINVQPFKDLDADNKTAVFTAIKNQKTQYPVKYNLWTKNSPGKIFANESLENVLKSRITKTELLAKPIKDFNSSWIIGTSEDLHIFSKMITYESGIYQARKGVDTSANAIYWIKIKEHQDGKIIFENSPEVSKKKIKYVEEDIIEEDLVYPLLRGKDILKWKTVCPYSIIIPYKEDGKVIPKSELKLKYEHTYNYFYNKNYGFLEILKNRGIVKKHYNSLKTAHSTPEYILYDIGKYTFSKYKVVWKALATGMIASVITDINNKLIIPDHNVVMIPLENEDEAYYLAGILNSKIVTRFVTAYISWFFSTHILENMNIPKFDNNILEHKTISELSKKAHLYTSQNKDVQEIELELDNLVEKILLQK